MKEINLSKRTRLQFNLKLNELDSLYNKYCPDIVAKPINTRQQWKALKLSSRPQPANLFNQRTDRLVQSFQKKWAEEYHGFVSKLSREDRDNFICFCIGAYGLDQPDRDLKSFQLKELQPKCLHFYSLLGTFSPFAHVQSIFPKLSLKIKSQLSKERRTSLEDVLREGLKRLKEFKPSLDAKSVSPRRGRKRGGREGEEKRTERVSSRKVEKLRLNQITQRKGQEKQTNMQTNRAVQKDERQNQFMKWLLSQRSATPVPRLRKAPPKKQIFQKFDEDVWKLFKEKRTHNWEINLKNILSARKIRRIKY